MMFTISLDIDEISIPHFWWRRRCQEDQPDGEVLFQLEIGQQGIRTCIPLFRVGTFGWRRNFYRQTYHQRPSVPPVEVSRAFYNSLIYEVFDQPRFRKKQRFYAIFAVLVPEEDSKL